MIAGAVRLAAMFVALIGVGACKRREVPFKPPPPDDAVMAADDAAPAVDAAAAAVKRTATKLAIGDRVTCAILSDATAACWGENGEGQLGNGTTTDAAAPVPLRLTGVEDLVLGAAHGCALLDDRSVACWGRINFGSKANLLVPTAVPGLAKVTRLFAVGGASCATVDDSSLVCWGDVDVRGHLRVPGPARMARVATPVEGLTHVSALGSNGALHMDGTVSYWAGDGIPVRTELADVRELASIGDEVCGLRADGSVACVGPSTRCAASAPRPAVPRPSPKAKGGPAGPKPKAGAKSKAGAKLKAGKAVVKARSAPVAAPALPVEVLKLPPAKHLAFDVGLCVVTATGKLQCVASGDGCKLDPPWPGLTDLETVTGSCARTQRGAVRCWAVDRTSRIVTAVAGVTSAVSLVGTSSHTCARLVDRSVACWGSNKSGALGRGVADEAIHPEAGLVGFKL